ncbi:purine-nucleoside phosphorylase [Chelativorans sp. SCAU2101]|jgi:purine nucleoside phosphorylase I, inosine and guanosine-specific|uniref:Purine nucleoside phosphorylase n=1 Tax=Chelativorans petroleitrophicus TaxID=2975484 RepID=A0A9X3B607_9HYPH|nr:purine-nucleoside phosphorylase [Chelativorans petroleitrophicus]MCT8989948.1 purine-nucleoside phosphorylase [Chelativorans petroleitrophicus]
MQESQLARLNRAHQSIRDRVGTPVEIAIMLGSGLGHLAEAVEEATVIPYAEIAGFPVSTAPSHKGQLVIGTLFGRRVAVMQGRLHLYEGWSPRDIALAVYLLRRLGAPTLVVTNAAGGLNPDYRPGDVMLIEDHMNFTGLNPLVGPNDDEIGLRFPDMSRAYDPDLLRLTEKAVERAGQEVRRGIYVGILGPSLETSAERRFLRASGGDAVGMSTVTEVIAAVHAGMRVVGLSAITNAATGGPDQKPDTVEEVLANAAICGRKIAAILGELLPQLPSSGS